MDKNEHYDGFWKKFLQFFTILLLLNMLCYGQCRIETQNEELKKILKEKQNINVEIEVVESYEENPVDIIELSVLESEFHDEDGNVVYPEGPE